VYKTLTDFLAWLSVNYEEGERYYALAVSLAEKVKEKTITGADWKELESHLAPYIPAHKVAVIRQALEQLDSTPVNQEVITEQVGHVKASFKGVAVKW
jgi:hypothetical protein